MFFKIPFLELLPIYKLAIKYNFLYLHCDLYESLFLGQSVNKYLWKGVFGRKNN